MPGPTKNSTDGLKDQPISRDFLRPEYFIFTINGVSCEEIYIQGDLSSDVQEKHSTCGEWSVRQDFYKY